MSIIQWPILGVQRVKTSESREDDIIRNAQVGGEAHVIELLITFKTRMRWLLYVTAIPSGDEGIGKSKILTHQSRSSRSSTTVATSPIGTKKTPPQEV